MYICLAAPTVLVNFFIHSCCSFLQSAYTFNLHAFCFSISLHHLLLPFCSTPCMLLSAMFVYLYYPYLSTFPPLISLCYTDPWWVSVPIPTTPSVLHLFGSNSLEEERQLIMRNLTWHNSRWMICQWWNGSMSDKQCLYIICMMAIVRYSIYRAHLFAYF